MIDGKCSREAVLERAMPITKLVLFWGNYGVIVRVVEDFFGVSIEKDRRFRSLVFPRQVACYLLWIFTDLKLREMAEIVGYTGDQKHSSVVYGIKSIKGLCKVDVNIRKKVIELEGILEIIGDDYKKENK